MENKYALLKLKDGKEVFGKVIDEKDRGIELSDVVTIKYTHNDYKSVPLIWMTKYCLFVKGYDVFFKFDDVMHVFRDPMKEFVDFYEASVKRIQKRDVQISEGYDPTVAKKKSKKIKLDYPEIHEEELIALFDAMTSGNTTIN